MKKLYSICFILCFCTNVFAQQDFSAVTNLSGVNKTIYYRITSTEISTVAVTYRGTTMTQYANTYSTYIVIPPFVTQGTGANMITYHVTSVDAGAFNGCTTLDSVVLPSSVTFIDSLAFLGCTKMTKCVLPSTINFIEARAFERCTNLPEIVLPNNITKISRGTFRDCHSLISVTIPNMVNTISEQAFLNCKSLGEVNISSSVTKISNTAFLGCYDLTSINVDTNNPVFMSEDGILYSYSQDTLLFYPPKKIGIEFTTPNAVKNIADYSFSYNLYLKKINFNNSLKKIGTAAFYNSTGLSVVNISDDVNYIGDGAFYNCRNLDTIKITAINPPELENFAFYNVPASLSLLVQCDAVEDYQNSQWGEYFYNIKGYNCTTGGTATPDIEFAQEENIFPNPVKDILIINNEQLAINNVEILDLAGRVVGTNLCVRPNQQDKHIGLPLQGTTTIDVSALPKGIYLVKIITNKSVITKKIIKN